MTRTEMLLDPYRIQSGDLSRGCAQPDPDEPARRILQIQVETPEQILATEDFRYPYILQGAVNGFNQTLLERDLVEEQLLFYARSGKLGFRWHYFEPRTYSTGLVSEEYFTRLLRRLR